MTARQQELVNKAKVVMPQAFINESPDDKILGFIELVISDQNWTPPYTNYDSNSIPKELDQITVLGTSIFASLFKQMEATLQDFNYSDNGLTVNVDQVGKIQTQHVNMLNIYKQQVDWSKKILMLRNGGQGLATPRFQSQISQFLKISLGSSFNLG